MKGDKIVRPFDLHSNETVTLRKLVSKHKQMRKFMLVFLGKFENRGIKIVRVNLIRITKINQFTLILLVLGSVVMTFLS